MNKETKGNTADLEVLALLLGLVVIACAVTAVLNQEAVYLCMKIVSAAGAVMNLTIATLKFIRGGKKQGICFVLMTVLLAGAFVMLQIYG